MLEFLDRAAESGELDEEDSRALYKALYAELRRIAGNLMQRRPARITLSPTELVHETYLRLMAGRSVAYEGRSHFLGVAAKAMRHVLVDEARRRAAARRGGGLQRVTLSSSALPANGAACEVVDLHRALQRLAERDSRMARVVELRVFAGMTANEAALLLGVSKRTVDSDWRTARLWLAKELCE